MQASILVVGAGYQAVQWACESGIPLGRFFWKWKRGGESFSICFCLGMLKLKSGSKFVLFSLFCLSVCFSFFFWNELLNPSLIHSGIQANLSDRKGTSN